MTFNWPTPQQFLRAAPLAALLAACSPVEATQEAPPSPAIAQSGEVHPISGLELGQVTVVTADKEIPFVTEFAITDQAQARGMMFRESMEDNEAMIFPSATPELRSFWMKNTPISLDIIFINAERRIANIETAMPYSLASVRSNGEVIAVFEIRGGLAAELGIKPGDEVRWEQP
ncbi:MAG: DUF192 domain-containing protein [Pseudomonadota bacterium]